MRQNIADLSIIITERVNIIYKLIINFLLCAYSLYQYKTLLKRRKKRKKVIPAYYYVQEQREIIKLLNISVLIKELKNNYFIPSII